MHEHAAAHTLAHGAWAQQIGTEDVPGVSHRKPRRFRARTALARRASTRTRARISGTMRAIGASRDVLRGSSSQGTAVNSCVDVAEALRHRCILAPFATFDVKLRPVCTLLDRCAQAPAAALRSGRRCDLGAPLLEDQQPQRGVLLAWSRTQLPHQISCKTHRPSCPMWMADAQRCPRAPQKLALPFLPFPSRSFCASQPWRSQPSGRL